MADPGPGNQPARSPLAARTDRRRILAAAAQVFAAHGYAGTDFERLGQAVQLDPLLVEAIFPDLEECLLCCYDDSIATAREALLASAPPPAAWHERFAAALCTLLALIEAHPAEARLVFVVAPDATEASTVHHLATLERLKPFFAAARALPSADAQVPPLLDSLIPVGLAFMIGSHLGSRSSQPITELYCEALRFGLLPYLGESETAVCLDRFPAPSASRSPSGGTLTDGN